VSRNYLNGEIFIDDGEINRGTDVGGTLRNRAIWPTEIEGRLVAP
jgi:hypothetical protein